MTSAPRIDIAGGRGFIGSAAAQALTSRGFDVRVFGRERDLAASNADGPSFGGRSSCSDGQPSGEQGFDELSSTNCHVLLWAAGGRSRDEGAMREAHVAAPLQAMANLRPKRMIYLSSAAVYGQLPVPFREADIAPNTAYGRLKAEGEEALTHQGAQLGIPVTTLRLAVIYGPGQRPSMLLPSAARALAKGEAFEASEGLQTRDFLFIDDVIRAIVTLAESAEPISGVFNLGSDAEVRVRDALLCLADQAGPKASDLLHFGQVPLREGEPLRYRLDIRAAQETFGWTPKVSLAEGMRQLIKSV